MYARLWQKVTLVIGISCLGAATIFTQTRAQEESEIRMLPPVASPVKASLLMRLTGSLQPLSRTNEEGLRTFKVFVGRKEWLFQLNYAETWSNTTHSWTILNDFFPTELRLTGAEDFLGPLQQPEMGGKRITIESRLHVADHMLMVTDAAEDAAGRH